MARWDAAMDNYQVAYRAAGSESTHAQATKAELNNAGEALETVRCSYYALAQRLQDRAQAEAYAADQAAQAALRETERVRIRETAHRSGLNAIKAKVTRGRL